MTDEEMPYSMFRGTFHLGPVEIECHVLNDGRRVITQREMVKAISGGRESGNLTRYVDRNPLMKGDLPLGPSIEFKVPGSPTIAMSQMQQLTFEDIDWDGDDQTKRKEKS